MELSEQIELASDLGGTVAQNINFIVDEILLRELLNSVDKTQMQFVAGLVLGKFSCEGWQRFNALKLKDWPKPQIAQLLAYMPFNTEAWEQAIKLLGEEEKQYWQKTNASPYWEENNLITAVDKLIQYGRPRAAINCIDRMLHTKQPLNINLTVKALMVALSSDEPYYANDVFTVTDIIKTLQSSDEISEDDLFKIEWAYLTILKGL